MLIQPPVRDFYLTRKRTIPYGLACIASTLKKEGVSVSLFDGLATSRSKIVDLPIEMEYLREFYPAPDSSPFSLFYHFRHFGYSYQHIAETAKQSGAFLIGISSLFTPYAGEALALAEAIKRGCRDTKIVLGGHHPTAFPEEVLKNDAVDYVLRGEGEVCMPHLAKAVAGNLPVESVPGIAYRLEDGGLHISPPAIMEDPNDFPLPALHLIRQSYYKRAGMGSTVVMAGRGCPMRCSYCSVSRGSYLTWRRRSVDSVMKELDEAVLGQQARFIDFEDENLSFDRSWFLSLLQSIRERYGHCRLELRAMNGLMPSTLDPHVIRAMKEAGFKTLNLSLGSTSREQLERFSRPNMQKDFESVLQCAQKEDLEAVGYIIIGAPHQDPAASLDDLVYLAGKPILAGLSVFYPSPGSADYELCRRLNLLPDHKSLTRSTALPLSHTTDRKETATLLRLGRIVNFMKYLVCNKKDRSPATQKGRVLLEMFLKDGIIRGIDEKGGIYEQNISLSLSRQFLKKLDGFTIRGVH